MGISSSKTVKSALLIIICPSRVDHFTDSTRSLTLEDAEVVMSHNQTSEVERGGAFAANGTVTLRRASLTATWRNSSTARVAPDVSGTR